MTPPDLRSIPFEQIRDEYIVRLAECGFTAPTICDLVDETTNLEIRPSKVYAILRRHQVSTMTYRRGQNARARETIRWVDRKVFGRARRHRRRAS